MKSEHTKLQENKYFRLNILRQKEREKNAYQSSCILIDNNITDILAITEDELETTSI